MKATTVHKLTLLGSLYTVQYLPLAFFGQALPVFMRSNGFSLETIGLTSLLSLPWMLKFLWAPLIDRYGSTRWGHYRSWILILQSLLALGIGMLAFFDIQQNLQLLLVGSFLSCFLSATQDIATDALAVKTLTSEERGLGNGIQTACNYLGAIFGGGMILVLLQQVKWKVSLLLMALSLVLPMILIWNYKEPQFIGEGSKQPYFTVLLGFFKRPRILPWLLIVVIYTMGVSLAAAMFRPLLVDLGLSLTDIGLLDGIVGYSAGCVGALVGGALIVSFGRLRALVGFGLLQALGVASYLLPASGIASLPILYMVSIISKFTSSMAYTALLTMIMDKSDTETAGTDYTIQVALVYFGSLGISAVSGFIAEMVGYTGVFLVGVILCFVSAWLIIQTRIEQKPKLCDR